MLSGQLQARSVTRLAAALAAAAPAAAALATGQSDSPASPTAAGVFRDAATNAGRA